MTPLRVALVCDFAEEQWPSMQLVATMLHDFLSREHRGRIEATQIRPPFVYRLSRSPQSARSMFNADRFINRFIDYPMHLRSIRDHYDVFHIVDHSYSHLVRELPAGRTVVTCHDLDAFTCILDPAHEPRSEVFRAMVRRTLDGLKNAARICCVSETTRAAVLTHGLMSPARTVTITNGVHPACSACPDPEGDAAASAILGPPRPGAIDLLHVGSTVVRKRIDLLLQTVATLRQAFPELRLLRVGGPFTAAQAELAAHLGVSAAIVVAPYLDPRTLAAIYRRAALLLLPSDAEGFGLPLVEAMACGTPVLASEIPALCEVGGSAAAYAAPNDLHAWTSAAGRLLEERINDPVRWAARRAAGLERARQFSWSETGVHIARVYHELVLGCLPPTQ